MPDLRSTNRKKQNTPLVVELVGLAGSGKTTLAKCLGQYYKKILIGPELELRKFKNIPIFAAQAPSLMPILLQRCPSSRWFTWDEIKAMAYLNGWHRMLSQQSMSNITTIILDHGPVFKLATLNAFGPERLKGQGVESWWDKMFEQWAQILDIVIWLEAPNAILRERINSRAQKHYVKEKSEPEVNRFLAKYRKSYEQILAKLKAHNGLSILKFDTNSTTLDQIVNNILEACNSKLSENSI